MTQKCAACGKDLPADASQCPNCGAPVNAPASTPTDTPPVQPATPTPQTPGAPASGFNPGFVGQIAQPANRRPRLSKKKKLLVGAALVLLLIVGVVFFILGNNSSSDDKKGSSTIEGRQSGSREKRPASNGTTDCYTVTLPAGATATDAGNCSINIKVNDTERPASIRSLSSGNNLQEQVDKWKKSLVASKGSLVSQNAVKLGNYDAIKYTYNRNQSSGNVYVSWFVFTGTKYQKDGAGPSAFEIRASYNDAQQQKAADDLVASLKWK